MTSVNSTTLIMAALHRLAADIHSEGDLGRSNIAHSKMQRNEPADHAGSISAARARMGAVYPISIAVALRSSELGMAARRECNLDQRPLLWCAAAQSLDGPRHP